MQEMKIKRIIVDGFELYYFQVYFQYKDKRNPFKKKILFENDPHLDQMEQGTRISILS